jgi:hypothetical protein
MVRYKRGTQSLVCKWQTIRKIRTQSHRPKSGKDMAAGLSNGEGLFVAMRPVGRESADSIRVPARNPFLCKISHQALVKLATFPAA